MNIQFASTINKKYLPGAIKFLKSLKTFNPNYNYQYNFLLIDDSLENKDIESLGEVYSDISIKKIKTDDYNYNNLSTKWRDWGFNCFNRFDIFLLNCDKLIFFDLDFICQSSLDEIINFNCDFGAVKGIRKNLIDHPSEEYFEGGLMIISKKFLNIETRNNLIELSKTKEWSSDEPVLNSYFKNISFIPKKFNVLTSEYNDYSLSNISLLHYVGSKKPWFSNNLRENFDDHIFLTQGLLTVRKLQDIYNQI